MVAANSSLSVVQDEQATLDGWMAAGSEQVNRSKQMIHEVGINLGCGVEGSISEVVVQ